MVELQARANKEQIDDSGIGTLLSNSMSKVALQSICSACKLPKSHNSGMMAELIRPSLLEFIRKRIPECDSDCAQSTPDS